ncbi:MAG TPA: OmpA family protein [Bacteroidia bacterium]|jgi:outer membrane protein OmpA-like peptidoglycan-associated protein|nr:OmpA family protein [Bacteroidia bacterium]
MKKLILFSFLFIVSYCKAQLPPGEYSTTNKKAIFIFESALKSWGAHKDEEAFKEATAAIQKAPEFIEPHLLLAEYYQTRNQYKEAIDEYQKAISINPKFNLNNFYNLAQLEMAVGDYKNAKLDYESFLKKPHPNPDSKETAEFQLANCDFAMEAMKNPVPFDPKNLGASINSAADEYFPAVTADDQTFLFTRSDRSHPEKSQEDFYISKKIDGNWTPSTLVAGVNTPGNEGAPNFSADGQLLFFVACQSSADGTYGGGRKGFGSCDIFYSQKVGNKWSQAHNMGPIVNSPSWESQPSFSADGKTLYFVSQRPGGLGGGDIWYANLKEDGSWGRPVNIGPNINTPKNEESVFIHPDGKTLYFGSNGRVGMGGLDLYVVRKNESGEWGKPVNLGYPINTYADENSILINGAGDLAYIASARAGGQGGLDMYQFELYEGARPGKITYMKGKVYDARTKDPIGAHFELIDLETSKSTIASDANPGSGEFLVVLPVEKNYALNVTQPGYAFYSENFSLKNITDKSKPYLMDVPLQPIDTGTVIELKNVFFETAKFDLKPESKVELDKLVSFLTLNKTLKIELDGHTDNVGDKKANQLLSQNRAKAVYDYLIAHGIDVKRLTYRGFGDTRPKLKNDTDENRAMNRRTEFRITGK